MTRAARTSILIFTILLWPAVAAAQVNTVFFFEDFDGVTMPDLPDGWSTTGGDWKTDDGSPSDGSGANNIKIIESRQDNLTTPGVDLSSASSATLSYLARRTSSFDIDKLRISASTDGGSSFPEVLLAAGDALPIADSKYVLIAVDLPAGLIGESRVVIRFEAIGGGSGSANLRLDDVKISGQASTFDVDPEALSFVAGVGETASKDVTATNNLGEAVDVAAPQVTGGVFSVDPSGAVNLADGASQVYKVTYTPVQEGESDGTLTLDYGDGVKTVDLSGSTAREALGFSSASQTVLERTDAVEIPLVLEHAAEAPLAGLQLDVGWDSDLITAVDVVRGAAVSDTDEWSLSMEEGSLHVLLLNEAGGGLAAAAYDPILTLVVDVGDLGGAAAAQVVFALSNVIGALAVPEGDDAGLGVGQATHTLTVEGRVGYFALSSTSLDLGEVAAGGTVDGQVTVTNPGGTQVLTVSSVDGTNDLFTVDPPTAAIRPDDGQTFTVTFAPTATAFGAQAGTLTFTHDGETVNTTQLTTSGTGTAGRGDPGGDGVVDVADVVQLIDFVLARAVPSAAQWASADLYPFPDGDGTLDVRDLTVLVQAIVNNIWPDEVALPAETQHRQAVTYGKTAGGVPVVVYLADTAGGLAIGLRHDVALRAFQMTLGMDSVPMGPATTPLEKQVGEMTMRTRVDTTARAMRLVLYRMDGRASKPTSYPLIEVPGLAIEDVDVSYLTAVGIRGRRYPVDVVAGTAVGAERPIDLPDAFALDPLFPNPFDPSQPVSLHIVLHVPATERVAWHVLDVLGRTVYAPPPALLGAGRHVLRWNGRDTTGRALSPGLYFVSATDGKQTGVRAVVLVR